MTYITIGFLFLMFLLSYARNKDPVIPEISMMFAIVLLWPVFLLAFLHLIGKGEL